MLPGREFILLGRKVKYSPEEKIYAVNEYLAGKASIQSIADKLGIDFAALKLWINNYEAIGADAFYNPTNRHYSKTEKEQAVNAYLSGEGSYMEICKRFKIRSTKQLRDWIKKYNSHEELKSSGTGGTVIMTKGRKTTFEERVEIASYCISHNRNYAETAEKFNISYQQARNYTIKYEDKGIVGLQDNRGRRKPEDTLSEVEKLKAELKFERAKRIQAEMEASFLKKIDEIERRRG